MDARLVWDTWRRILTDDQLVERVLHPGNPVTGEATKVTDAESAIVADYASTLAATETNIGMYRQGLVRNALAALTLVPLTRRVFYETELDVEAVASDFVRSTGYVDAGPNFWRIAGGFVAHLAQLPEFASSVYQDVLAVDASAVALARRLGESAPTAWPDDAAALSEARRSVRDGSIRFVASRAAVATSSSCDLTEWLESPEDCDVNEELEPSARHWLIFFPTAESAHTYAELSERAARAFRLLSTPKTVAEISSVLDGLPDADVKEVIDSLEELGVVQRHTLSGHDRP